LLFLASLFPNPPKCPDLPLSDKKAEIILMIIMVIILQEKTTKVVIMIMKMMINTTVLQLHQDGPMIPIGVYLTTALALEEMLNAMTMRVIHLMKKDCAGQRRPPVSDMMKIARHSLHGTNLISLLEKKKD
jgi:hypothetical protein